MPQNRQRHGEDKRRRHCVRPGDKGAIVRSCDFRCDVQAKPKALLQPLITSEKRLEQFVQRFWRDRLPPVGNGNHEFATSRGCLHHDRLILRTMGKCIAQQVREQLPDAHSVAIDRLAQVETRLDSLVGRDRPELGHHLAKNRLQRFIGIPVESDTAAEPPPRKIEHIVDERRRAQNAAAHQFDHPAAPLA